MDGSTVVLGFLLGLFVSLLIIYDIATAYFYTETRTEEPESVARWDKTIELQSKVQVLENDWFESHPCIYRKNREAATGTHGYSFVYENVPFCHYPNPEGKYINEKDMLSYCAKCKVRVPNEETNDSKNMENVLGDNS